MHATPIDLPVRGMDPEGFVGSIGTVTLLACSDCMAVVIPDNEGANWAGHEAFHQRSFSEASR